MIWQQIQISRVSYICFELQGNKHISNRFRLTEMMQYNWNVYFARCGTGWNTTVLGSCSEGQGHGEVKQGKKCREEAQSIPFLSSQLATSVEGLRPQTRLQRKKLLFFWGSEILTPWLLPCGALPS